MKIFIAFILLFSALSFAKIVPATQQCGTERWSVKTLQDTTLDQINFDHVEETTVREMTEWEVPDHKPETTRIKGIETTVWRVHAMLIGYKFDKKKTADGDFHVVFADHQKKNGHWVTMIGELPKPECGNPQYAKVWTDLRDFMATMGVLHSGKFLTFDKPIPVVIEGVGFFDKIHGTFENEDGTKGQEGVAQNGIELHPILKLEKDDDENDTGMQVPAFRYSSIPLAGF